VGRGLLATCIKGLLATCIATVEQAYDEDLVLHRPSRHHA
jgi:hypothetical protein